MNDGEAIPLLARSASRGVIAAMAMSGVQTVTRGLGLLEQTPPDALADERSESSMSSRSGSPPGSRSRPTRALDGAVVAQSPWPHDA